MASIERDAQSPTENGGKKLKEGVAIVVTPGAGENVSVNETPEGGYTIFLKGEIRIAVGPGTSEATESVISARNGQDNGLVPETSSSKASAPQNGSKKASETASPTTESPTPIEQENRKFELVGNPVFDPKYKARKSGKRIADFALATHEKDGATKYWRIRAFDKTAERVRDTVRKGQKDVEAVVYGPKQWQQKKKTPDGWTQETVQGYYAGMVRVPEKYREKPKGEPTRR